MTENRPRILFLAHLLPYPPDGGAKIKSYYTLKALAAVYDVTLVAFVRSEAENQYIKELRPYCVGGVQTVVIRRSKVKNVLDATTALLTRRSFIISRDSVAEMRKAVRERLEKQRFVAVHIDHLQMAQYALPRKTGARLILDHHNIESIIYKRLAETTSSRLKRMYLNWEWPKLERYEVDIAKQVDYTITVTDEDAAILRAFAPDEIKVGAVPIGVDGTYFYPVDRDPDSKTLLSIGTMYWQPNVEGMMWFYERMWPLIKQEMPEVRLHIVGNRPTQQIQSLAQADPNITVTGYVDDVRLSARDCAVFIVPLLAGSGMRVKILNALAMALPIVSTRIGAEGIGVTDGKDILLANNPENFARACVKLLRDAEMRDRMGAAGRELVEKYYSWDAIGRLLLSIYTHVLAGPGQKTSAHTDRSSAREKDRAGDASDHPRQPEQETFFP